MVHVNPLLWNRCKPTPTPIPSPPSCAIVLFSRIIQCVVKVSHPPLYILPLSDSVWVCWLLLDCVFACLGCFVCVLCVRVCELCGFTSWEIKLKSESQKWLKKSEIYVFSLQFRVNSHIYRTSGCQTFVYLNFMFFELSASDFRRKHPHPHP